MWPGHGIGAGMLQGYMGRVSFLLAATSRDDRQKLQLWLMLASVMLLGTEYLIHMHCNQLSCILLCRAHHTRATTGQCKACSRWVPTDMATQLPTVMACTIPCSIRVGATEACRLPANICPSHGIVEEGTTQHPVFYGIVSTCNPFFLPISQQVGLLPGF